MTNVPPLAASAAPIRSGTDDGVRAGRSVRASSKRGAVVGGPVVEVVLDIGDVVLGLRVVVVGGTTVVVVLSGRVNVVVLSGRVCVLVGRTMVVVLRPMVGVASSRRHVALEAPSGIASVSAASTTRPRGPAGGFIGGRSHRLR